MLREGTGGRARGWETSQGRNPRGRGLQGAVGREGGEERNSQRFSPTLLPGPLEEFTDGRKTEEEQSWWTGQELTQGAGGLQMTSGHPRGDTKEARG